MIAIQRGISGVSGRARNAIYAEEYVMCHGLPVMKYRSHPTHVGDVMTAYTAAKMSQFRQSFSAEPIYLISLTAQSYSRRIHDISVFDCFQSGSNKCACFLFLFICDLRRLHERFWRRVFLDIVYKLPHEVNLIVDIIHGMHDDILIAVLIPCKTVEHNGKEL